MDYISQKTRFGSYKDGKYFSGIIEYYYATLATEVTSGGEPIPPTFIKNNWKNNIQSTKFGNRYENEDDVEDPCNGIVYKYLWNVEEVATTDSANNVTYTQTGINLLQEYIGGKIPARYISYYAANSEAQVPGTPPSIGTDEDGKPIIVITGDEWQLDSDFDKGADADTYLFEITFVEYAPDDEGIVTYEKIEGPTLIGRNGKDSITLVLDNDSDIIAVSPNGKIIGQNAAKSNALVTVTASVIKNGYTEPGIRFNIFSAPTGFVIQNHYKFENGILEIYDIPEGFTSGNFVICDQKEDDTDGDLRATFGLRTTTSNVDYNLNITPTVVNNSLGDGTITVKVNKTKEDGTVTMLEGPGSENIEIYVDGDPLGTTGEKWNAITYTKEQTQDIKVILKEGVFIWDEETIEFVQNGLTAQSLKIINEKNAFNYTSDGEPYPEQSIEFTLQGSNIDTGEAIWTAKDGDFCYKSGSGNTFNLTPGLLSNQVDQTKHKDINIGRIRFLFSEGGKVFCGDTNNRIFSFNSETGFWEILINNNSNNNVTGLSSTPLDGIYFEGSYYFIAYNQAIYKYDGEQVSRIKAPISDTTNDCYEAIIANEEKIIIVGKKNRNHCLWTLEEGRLGSGQELDGTGAICDICKIDNETFFAGGQNGYIHLIKDGESGLEITSQQLAGGGNFTIRTVYYHDDKYFVGYQDETITTGEGADTSLDKNSYIVSLKWNNSVKTFEILDSINLTSNLGKNGWVRSITYFNRFYYAFCYTSGASTGKIFSSIDGKNWQSVFTGNIKACWCSAIVGNQLYWAGESGTIQKFKGTPNLVVTVEVDSLYDKVGISSLVDASSPYVLSLTNDGATIGATTDGEVDGDLLKTISATTAELSYGDIQETNVQFDWSVYNESGTIAVPVDGKTEREGVVITNSPTICFTAMSKETASATVSAYLMRNGIKADHPIAKKVFTITKNKSGNSAVAYQLNVAPNKVNEADFTGNTYRVQLAVTKHNGKEITNLTEGYSIKVDSEDKGLIDEYLIEKKNTTFSLYINDVFQDSETVEVTPVLYDYKAVASPSQITAGSFPTEIYLELRQVGKGSSQSVFKKIRYRVETSGDFTEVKNGNGELVETDSFALPKANYANEADPFVVEIQYDDGTEWKLFDKVTITVLQDAVTNYTIYHDVWKDGTTQQTPGPNVTIGDIPSYPEKGEESTSPTYGWYQGIRESSVYQSIKSCKPSEAATTPWSQQIRLSGVLSTKQDLLDILDKQGTEDDGIYNEDGNILINATAIKTGALKVADDNNNSYFEAGWDSGGMPLVKIGGVDFTGYVPGGQTSNIDLFNHSTSDTAITTRPEGGRYTIGPRLSDSDNSVSFCSYLSYKTINKEIVLQVGKKGETSFGTDEPYYRFSVPSATNLYNLKTGRTYILTGEAKLEFPEGETDYSNSSALFLRNQYYDGREWADYPKIIACCANEEYRSFSRKFTVPTSAKGYYCSFQVMTKDGDSIQGINEKPFKGCFYLKNLKLVEDSALNVSGGYSWKFDQQDGLMMWSGAQGNGTITGNSPDPNLMFKIYKESGKGKLWLKGNGEFTGKIIANNGMIGSVAIDEVASKIFNENLLLNTYLPGNGKFILQTASEKGLKFNLKEKISNKKVALQFKIKGKVQNNNAKLRAYFIMRWLDSSTGNANQSVNIDTLKENSFETFKTTFTIPSNKELLQVFICTDYQYSTAGDWFEIQERTLKLEEGEKFTDWALAPGDQVSKNFLTNGAGTVVDTFNTEDEHQYFDTGTDYRSLNHGTVVTISFDLEMKINSISFTSQGTLHTKPFLWVYNTNRDGDNSFESKQIYFENCAVGDTIKGRYSVQTKIIAPSDNSQPSTVDCIEFYSGYTSKNYYKISNLKLALGNNANIWEANPANSLPANLSGNYSWKFSPTEGIKMWNGSQTADPIFRVDKDGLYMKGNGEFTGTITADGGKIANLEISDFGLSSDYLTISNSSLVFKTSGTLELESEGQRTIVFNTLNELDNGEEKGPVQLYTTGERPFVIKNEGGAGLEFLQYTETQTAKQKVKIFAEVESWLSGTSTFYGIAFKYEVVGDNGTLPTRVNVYPYYHLDATKSIIITLDATAEGLVDLTIPSSNHSGYCTINGVSVSKPGALASGLDSYIVERSGHSVVGVGVLKSYESPKLSLDISGSTVSWVSYLEKEVSALNNSNNILYSLGSINPKTTTLSLGDTNHKWKAVVVQTGGFVENSDINSKNSISPLKENYSIFFDLIQPSLYRLNDDDSFEMHCGFVAQQIKQSLVESNIVPSDFSGLYFKGENESMALRYNEFIALNTWQIQKLKPRMASAEEKLIAYETRISALETEIENLKSS